MNCNGDTLYKTITNAFVYSVLKFCGLDQSGEDRNLLPQLCPSSVSFASCSAPLPRQRALRRCAPLEWMGQVVGAQTCVRMRSCSVASQRKHFMKTK